MEIFSGNNDARPELDVNDGDWMVFARLTAGSFLRVDPLSVLLSMAKAGANSDVLVVDRVGGLVTGAVAERLGGSETSMDIVRMFNFNNENCKRIVRASLSDLASVETTTSSGMEDTPTEESNGQNSSIGVADVSLTSGSEVGDIDVEAAISAMLKLAKALKLEERPHWKLLLSGREVGSQGFAIKDSTDIADEYVRRLHTKWDKNL